jgi:diguanylate cyclase (GGDEF)-like protein
MKKLPWFIFTFLFLLLASAAAWFTLDRIKEESLKTIKNSLQTVTQITHETLHIWINNRQQDIVEISQADTFLLLTKRLLQADKNKQAKLVELTLNKLRVFMQQKMKVHQDIGFFIIAPNKINIASMRDTNLNEINVIFKKRPIFFERLFAGETLFIPPIHSDVPLLMANGELVKNLPTLFIGTPVYDENQNIIAVLTLRLDPSSDFTRLTQLGRIGSSGETYAFDKNALLITNSRFDKQLQDIGLLTVQEQAMLTIRIADPGGNILEGFKTQIPRHKLPLTVMAKSAIAGETSFNIDGYHDYRGVLVFGSWLWDSSLGFGLATEIDVAEALTSYYKIRNTLIMFVFATAIVFLCGFLIWLRIEKNAFTKLEDIVEERTKELQALSYKDGLTEISNRRMFDQSLEQEWHRAMRHRESLSLIMIDIDFFKAYNDNYGHLQGDHCLKQVAQLLASTSQRETDIIARYGGEEFAILLPNTNLEQALAFAEKCRINVLNKKISHGFTQVANIHSISISVGVSAITPVDELSIMSLIEKADAQLYLAKKQGRNRVE